MEFGREKRCYLTAGVYPKKLMKTTCDYALIEEFKNCLPVDIKTYVDEQKTENLHQAASLAALTHISRFGRVSQSVRENQRSPGDSQPSTSNSHSNSQDRNEPTHRSPRFPSGPTFYCKNKGHILSECRALEKKNQKSSHMMVATKDAKMNCAGTLDCGPLTKIPIMS